jgi:catechol 2,3-dioxygenase-like lactoylglutathione lyase family enzyme
MFEDRPEGDAVSTLDFAPRFNHVAIQTDDVDSTVTWYREFLGAAVEWTMHEDQFSPLTTSRLPGIRTLTEVKAGELRFHVFDRAGHDRTGPGTLNYQFQHVGVLVDTPEQLGELRDRYLKARANTDLVWFRDQEPSDIVTDPDGMQSLYVLDPNGLELEFIFLPGDAT